MTESVHYRDEEGNLRTDGLLIRIVPKTYFSSDDFKGEIQLDKWMDYVPHLIASLELTDTKMCNDVKAIGYAVRDDEQQLILRLNKPDYAGHILMTYSLIYNTDKIALFYTRVRKYTHTTSL